MGLFKTKEEKAVINYNKAMVCKEQKRYADMLAYLEKAVNFGSVEATHELGYAYYIGTGVKRNRAQALTFFQKSAAFGYAPSEFLAGYILWYGLDTKCDLASGYKYVASAARKEHKYAMNLYGQMLLHGLACTKNKEAGLEYLRKAAVLGVEEALEELNNELKEFYVLDTTKATPEIVSDKVVYFHLNYNNQKYYYAGIAMNALFDEGKTAEGKECLKLMEKAASERDEDAGKFVVEYHLKYSDRRTRYKWMFIYLYCSTEDDMDELLRDSYDLMSRSVQIEAMNILYDYYEQATNGKPFIMKYDHETGCAHCGMCKDFCKVGRMHKDFDVEGIIEEQCVINKLKFMRAMLNCPRKHILVIDK